MVRTFNINNVFETTNPLAKQHQALFNKLQFTRSSNQVWRTDQEDDIKGTNQDEAFFGLAGNDTIRGIGGDDFIDGGTGADKMIGGTGNDIYIVDNAGDRAIEWANSGDNDWVYTYAHNTDLSYGSHHHPNYFYQLPTFVEHLRLMGDENLRAVGNDLDNIILGNDGNNKIDGGTGADTRPGRAGNDSYVVDSI